ncbi:MAG TPA: GNAT family N-acetyltransferase [Candidatus Dormibacteraeota bacterium]
MSGTSEIELPVAPAVVWNELVSAGPRAWYHGLRAEGAFEPGARIRWVGDDGQSAEESEVLAIEPERRLRLRTRFTFAPRYAEAPEHELEYALEPAGGGTRVRLTWSGEGPGVAFLAAEGRYVLPGLRLAADPAAQAEIARRERIGPIEIADVTPERLGDYQSFFDHDAFRDYPVWAACYCATPMIDSEEDRTPEQNRAEVSERIDRGELTALLAYAEGKPVAWCHWGTVTRLAGIKAKFGLDPGEQDGVGSLACFVVSSPYRGHGLAGRLLEAALDRMRAAGLEFAEGYPLAAGETAQANWRGPLEMYLRAGFEPYREAGKWVVVRRRL